MDSLDSLRKQLIKSARESVRSELSSPDIIIVKSMNLLEDLDRIFNLMAEHCIEFYSIHFPELKEIIPENETLLKLIAELGDRKNFEHESVFEILKDENWAEEISKTAENSMGAMLSEKELKEVSALAVNALKIKQERTELEAFASDAALKIAPNFSQVAGSLLAARLISKAGSLKSLALMPSSKIQLLGAEKALFRHLRSHGNALPPKHGLIFQHSLVQQLKPWQQGAMARSLAGKISIAARADFFKTREKIDSKLQASLSESFARLEKKKQKPRNPALKQKFSRENPMLPRKFQPFKRQGNFRHERRERFDRNNRRPRHFEGPRTKQFNNSGVNLEKLRKSRDFRKNSFKKPGKLRFIKTKE